MRWYPSSRGYSAPMPCLTCRGVGGHWAFPVLWETLGICYSGHELASTRSQHRYPFRPPTGPLLTPLSVEDNCQRLLVRRTDA